ncbi:MAG: PilZ domain-containing protein [Sphingomonas sp.]|nr:PilZ domain-containing protein [Sphingomonas sp.]
MPMLAHFEELAPKERRRAARRALRLGIGSKDVKSGFEQVTIHDLSLTGALLETSIPMLNGAIFEFELPQAGLVEAEIIWSSGEYYGAQFTLPIAPSALSAAILKAQPISSAGEAVDPLSELKELNAEVERVALKMESALARLSKKEL